MALPGEDTLLLRQACSAARELMMKPVRLDELLSSVKRLIGEAASP